jgi:hypothetical protein
MRNPLEQLVGQCVTESWIVHDYAQLRFGNAGILTIINDYTVDGDKTLSELDGLVLASAAQDTEQVVLTFDNGTTLRVSLNPNAYHGPEAIVLHREGQPTVVWN